MDVKRRVVKGARGLGSQWRGAGGAGCEAAKWRSMQPRLTVSDVMTLAAHSLKSCLSLFLDTGVPVLTFRTSRAASSSAKATRRNRSWCRRASRATRSTGSRRRATNGWSSRLTRRRSCSARRPRRRPARCSLDSRATSGPMGGTRRADWSRASWWLCARSTTRRSTKL